MCIWGFISQKKIFEEFSLKSWLSFSVVRRKSTEENLFSYFYYFFFDLITFWRIKKCRLSLSQPQKILHEKSFEEFYVKSVLFFFFAYYFIFTHFELLNMSLELQSARKKCRKKFFEFFVEDLLRSSVIWRKRWRNLLLCFFFAYLMKLLLKYEFIIILCLFLI